jgi:hypothetical protein
MTGNHDFFVNRQTKVLRQIILDLRQGHCPR